MVLTSTPPGRPRFQVIFKEIECCSELPGNTFCVITMNQGCKLMSSVLSPQILMSAVRPRAPTVAVKTHLEASAVSVTMVTSSRTTPVQVNTLIWSMIKNWPGNRGITECVCVCSDVNECAEPSQCPGQMCVNSVGSYRCVSCRPGYTLTNRQCTGTHTHVLTSVHEQPDSLPNTQKAVSFCSIIRFTKCLKANKQPRY